MKKSGSAMIIACLLIAAVGSVAFGIGRLFFIDLSLSDLYDSSIIAYYTSESGVEEGLLRYRYNKDTEVPVFGYNTKVSRNYLSNSSAVIPSLDPKSESAVISDGLEKIYDLNINYTGRFYANDVDKNGCFTPDEIKDDSYATGENSVFYQKRDEAVKIDITKYLDKVKNNDSGSRTLFRYDQTSDSDNSFFEVKITGRVLGRLMEYKAVLAKRSGSTYVMDLGSEGVIELARDTGEPDGMTYYIDAIKNKVAKSAQFDLDPTGSDPNKRVELYIKPVGKSSFNGAKIAIYSTDDLNCADTNPITLADSSPNISTPWTTIKSTGYYGGVTRTLEAKIDRQSGTVYDLFDFVVYKK